MFIYPPGRAFTKEWPLTGGPLVSWLENRMVTAAKWRLLMLNAHATVDARDSEVYTALHLATANGHEGVVRLLAEMEADIAAEDEKGEMALHMAAANGYGGVVRLLLENGADIEAKVGPGQGNISSYVDNISTERQQSPGSTLQYSDEDLLVTRGRRANPAQSGLDDGLGCSQARPIVLEEDEPDNATA